MKVPKRYPSQQRSNKSAALFLRIVFIAFLLLAGCQSNSLEYVVTSFKERPVIDGLQDSCWLDIPLEKLSGDVKGALYRNGDEDLSASFRCARHEDSLYFFIDIVDDRCRYYSDSLIRGVENDMIQLFFAEGGRKLSVDEMTKQDSIFQLNFVYDQYKKASWTRCRFAQVNTINGYAFEILIPIVKSTYDVDSKKIGFTIEMRDNDNDSDPTEGAISGVETTLSWSTNGGKLYWQSTQYYGDLILKDYHQPAVSK